MVLAPLFPLVPWFWSLLVLQLVNGATVSFGWSGAQTLIAQLATGEARHLGRFTFFAQLGVRQLRRCSAARCGISAAPGLKLPAGLGRCLPGAL